MLQRIFIFSLLVRHASHFQQLWNQMDVLYFGLKFFSFLIELLLSLTTDGLDQTLTFILDLYPIFLEVILLIVQSLAIDEMLHLGVDCPLLDDLDKFVSPGLAIGGNYDTVLYLDVWVFLDHIHQAGDLAYLGLDIHFQVVSIAPVLNCQAETPQNTQCGILDPVIYEWLVPKVLSCAAMVVQVIILQPLHSVFDIRVQDVQEFRTQFIRIQID